MTLQEIQCGSHSSSVGQIIIECNFDVVGVFVWLVGLGFGGFNTVSVYSIFILTSGKQRKVALSAHVDAFFFDPKYMSQTQLG